MAVNLIIPEEIIEEAVDKYLSNIFGREVFWEDADPYKAYKIRVIEFMEEPLKIDNEKFSVGDEWYDS